MPLPEMDLRYSDPATPWEHAVEANFPAGASPPFGIGAVSLANLFCGRRFAPTAYDRLAIVEPRSDRTCHLLVADAERRERLERVQPYRPALALQLRKDECPCGTAVRSDHLDQGIHQVPLRIAEM